MSGVLYVVSTPIGNLQDLTPRAAATLASVDFIAAEDTRVTLNLLRYLNIKKPLTSYNQHNAAAKDQAILSRLHGGESCALCSDAGTPAISDPGEQLVTKALEGGITVVPIPAASAVITALSVSGQPSGRFVFEGFLPQNKRQRALRLAALQSEERTIVFYEAPHKLLATLQHLADAFGKERPATVCRELTKLHEEVMPTTLGQATLHYSEHTPRGEFVLVVAGAPPMPPAPEYTLTEAARLAADIANTQQLSASEAAKQAAKTTGLGKSAIYSEMQKLQ